jgi:hypothetical protein
MTFRKSIVPALLSLAVAGVTAAQAQVVITFPDSSQTTIMTADVTAQASVLVPPTVTFAVTNVAHSTTAAGVALSATNIILAQPTDELIIGIEAAAASFTPPVALATTWAATDVSWTAASFTGGTGSAGTALNNTAFQTVVTCTAGVSTCSTSALAFTLAANTGVTTAGNHTLTVKWNFADLTLP